MTQSQRTKALLGVLAVFLAVALVPRLIPSSSESNLAAGTSPVRRGAERADVPLVDEVVDLNIAALTPQLGHVAIGRDPWRFAPKPAPPPPPRLPPPVRVVEAPAPPPPAPTGPQPPSSDHLAYLGSFGPRDAQIAVVRGRDELWVVRAGDVLEGSFTIQNIGLESVDIGFIGFPDTKPRRLGLGG